MQYPLKSLTRYSTELFLPFCFNFKFIFGKILIKRFSFLNTFSFVLLLIDIFVKFDAKIDYMTHLHIKNVYVDQSNSSKVTGLNLFHVFKFYTSRPMLNCTTDCSRDTWVESILSANCARGSVWEALEVCLHCLLFLFSFCWNQPLTNIDNLASVSHLWLNLRAAVTCIWKPLLFPPPSLVKRTQSSRQRR